MMMWTKWPRTKRKLSYYKQWKCHNSNKILLYSIVLIGLMAKQVQQAQSSSTTAQCPPQETMPGCPCYNFEDGLFLECAGATEESLKAALTGVLNVARSEGAMVQSLSIYELDRKVEELKASVFPIGTKIRHLQISHSSIKEINENALERLRQSLESLGLVSGKLQQIPQKAFTKLSLLRNLDLESNNIQDLPSYSFYELSLIKLNLKSNQIIKISEYAFAGLENTLNDLDMAENKIRIFPMTALRRLNHLITLRLAWNEISQLPEDGYSRLDALKFLDLSSNNFEIIPLNCFRCCPSLKTLTLYYNSVEIVDKDAFISLIYLETIDLSHNKIVYLDIATFRANQKLKSIDLSHNHIHYIRGIFSRLPELKELFLTENNILEIPANAFSGSTSLSVVYLQRNAIKRLDSRGLATLSQLAQLHLTENYITKLPRDFLKHCENLSTLSLDSNNIRELEVGTFAKAKQLRELRLQDNQITEVRRGVFAPLPSLLELHLQNNAITDMETGALRSLHSLQHVNLQGNLLAVLGDVFQISNDSTQNAFDSVASDSINNSGSSSSSSGTNSASNSINNNNINNNGDSGGGSNSYSVSSGSSLISIQLDNNGLGVLHNDSLRGQTSVRIMWLGHNRLTRLQAPLFRDLLLVERLYLTNNSISRIEDTAFQPMQALKFLELSMNRLSHVTVKTFSELHELEELYLQDNGLRTFEPYALTALKRLRILDLANNHLNILHNTIFQEGLPIRTLNLRNCSVSIIEQGAFRGLNNLYELNLEYNHLTSIALDRLDIPGLRVLKISNNNFSQINGESLDGLPSLQYLSMESTQIHRIPTNIFSNNKNLIKLLLSNNLLHILPGYLFIGLESLKEVKLDGNRFQELPYEVFINSSSIEFLSLAYNKILHVDVSRLNGLINLRELDFRNNFIMTLSGFTNANFSKLITIDLSYNHLTSLPSNFFIHANQLRKIELSGNKFRQIPAVALSAQNIPNLNWLNITANPLTKIHELTLDKIYENLQEIHISSTNLTIVTSQDFQAFPGLMHLFMQNNLIVRISPSAFLSLINLLTLDLSMNELELLPSERLKGLEHLKLLNLTHNRLKEVEDFPLDLKALQILDLSYNQLTAIEKTTFQHLENLAELHLYGNLISLISSDAFKPLKKLRLLDLSKNYLKNLPLNIFRPLETQIRSLRADENPLHCGCESQELWEWLQDHQKLVGSSVGRHRNGMGINDVESGLLRCEQPPELRGLVFLDLDPHAFCSSPLILKLSVQDIQPFSVLISWQSRNHTGLHGYQLAYHPFDKLDEVRGNMVDPNDRSWRLSKLSSNTRYRICIVGLGNWLTHNEETNVIGQFNSTKDNLFDSSSLPEMVDSATSKCIEVKTLEIPIDAIVVSSDGAPISDASGVASILTRRLGLIVGCCMGFIVFILLISVIGYLKVKKQREAVKRDQQPIPPEYISYRHFSIQSGETGNNAVRTNLEAQSFTNNIGTTNLNV